MRDVIRISQWKFPHVFLYKYVLIEFTMLRDPLTPKKIQIVCFKQVWPGQTKTTQKQHFWNRTNEKNDHQRVGCKNSFCCQGHGLPMLFAKGQLDSGSVLIYQLGFVFCIALKFCLHNVSPCISTGISKIQIALTVLNVTISHQMTCRNDQHLQNSDLPTVSTVKW